MTKRLLENQPPQTAAVGLASHQQSADPLYSHTTLKRAKQAGKGRESRRDTLDESLRVADVSWWVGYEGTQWHRSGPMSEEQLKVLLARLSEDADLRAKFQGAADLETAVAMAQEAGFDVSEEDWEIVQRDDAELSEADAQSVAGGILVLTWRLPWKGSWQFCQWIQFINLETQGRQVLSFASVFQPSGVSSTPLEVRHWSSALRQSSVPNLHKPLAARFRQRRPSCTWQLHLRITTRCGRLSQGVRWRSSTRAERPIDHHQDQYNEPQHGQQA